MKCDVCNPSEGQEIPDIEIWDKPIDEHLVFTFHKDSDEAHLHGPIYDKNKMINIIKMICNEMDWECEYNEPQPAKVTISRQLMMPNGEGRPNG